MSEITGAAKVHEAYAFAYMRCGHGWEESYEIEHHVDISGHEFVIYKAGGLRVPSPLSSPSCPTCGGHVVRIMRSGQVSSLHGLMAQAGSIAGPWPSEGPRQPEQIKKPEKTEKPEKVEPAEPGHHWHLSDLLHPFHRK